MKKNKPQYYLWENKDREKEIDKALNRALAKSKVIKLKDEKKDIRDSLPLIKRRGKMIQQGRVNLYRNKSKDEEGKTIISGFPLKDDRHTRISSPHGFVDGTFIGFMDDVTPVRLRQEPADRFSNKPDRV